MLQFELVVQVLALALCFVVARKTRSRYCSRRSCLVLSFLLVIYIYTRIAITFIVIGKGPALVVVAAVFRTSHISHTFESEGCTS